MNMMMMMDKSRTSMNCITLVFTCCLLLFAMELSSGELTSGIHKMTKDINRALLQVLSQIQDIEYTKMNSTVVYNSSSEFNAKGMAVLYNFTHLFTKALIPNILPPEDLVMFDDQDFMLRVKDDDYLAVAKYYMNFLIFLSAILLFGLLMPLCGFCFCCCRCCCSGNDRRKASPKNRDLCKKIVYATLLIALGTLFLFGVVCSFATNEQMEEGTSELPSNLEVAIDDTNAYIADTKKHVNILLNKNFGELSSVVINSLNDSSNILQTKLVEVTNAVSLDEALKIANGMNSVKKHLDRIKLLTNTLRVDASQLNDAMRKLKGDLLQILNKCEHIESCKNLKNEYVIQLGTNIDFNSFLDRYFPRIPDLQGQLHELDEFIGTNTPDEIQKGKDKLDKIGPEIESKLRPELQTIERAILDAGEEVKKQSLEVLNLLDDAAANIDNQKRDVIPQVEKYIKEYSKYRYYVGIGISCVFLLIALCIALGLICGVCGKKPSVYDDDCCNKGAGSSFLMFGVSIMFLTATILVIVLIVYMMGMFAKILVCEPMRKPKDNEIIQFIDDHFSLKEKLNLDTTISKILNSCYQNKGAYEVFNLESKIDLNKVQNYMEEFQIDEKLKHIEEAISKGVINIDTLVDEKTFENLRKLSNLDVNFDQIVDELKINFTSVDLKDFNMSLTNLIITTSNMNEINSQLKLTQIQVDAYIERVYNPMKAHATEVIGLAEETREMLKFGHDSFKKAILALIDNLKEAQNKIVEEGSATLIDITQKFAKSISEAIQKYLDLVVNEFKSDVGNCRPIMLIINGTLTSTCDKVIAPMTGFGFSILWCLTHFIPIIIVSVKLSTLYRKTDVSSNAYIETEYLYDAYADRENIPLARGKHGKKKQKKKRHDGRNYMETCPDPGREYPGGSQHPDARYADMAPKHFEDYPNGGPPQYQRTEYERPPPYYYPGSGEQPR